MMSLKYLSILAVLSFINLSCTPQERDCQARFTYVFADFMGLARVRDVDKEIIRSKRDPVRKALLSCPSDLGDVNTKAFPYISRIHLQILAGEIDAVRDYLQNTQACENCTSDVTDLFHFASMYGSIQTIEIWS